MFSLLIIIREAFQLVYSVEEHLNPQVLVQSDDGRDSLKYSISQFSFHSLFGQIFANFKSVLISEKCCLEMTVARLAQESRMRNIVADNRSVTYIRQGCCCHSR